MFAIGLADGYLGNHMPTTYFVPHHILVNTVGGATGGSSSLDMRSNGTACFFCRVIIRDRYGRCFDVTGASTTSGTIIDL